MNSVLFEIQTFKLLHKNTLALLSEGYRNTCSYGMPKVMGHDNHVLLAHTLYSKTSAQWYKQNDLEA